MAAITWRQATKDDVGRLARFADRRGDDWTYGMYAGIDVQEDVYSCVDIEGCEPELFLICEVQDVVVREAVLDGTVGTVTKPAWAEWNPDIFQQTLPGLPYMMPDSFLPAKDCANCLFHREDWRGEGFCYMFVTEPTGDKCGQFKYVEGSIMKTELEQAVEIVEKLQDWIDNFEGLSVIPIANVCWSPMTMQICIADHVVYCCQEGGELTFENCRDAWLEHVNALLPFTT